MVDFKNLMSTFSGRINLLVLLTEVYMKNNLKYLPYFINLLLLEERPLNNDRLDAIDTLLHLPLTFIKNTTNTDWRLHENYSFVKKMKMHYRNYLQYLPSVSYKISFRRNILFYRDLERMAPSIKLYEFFRKTPYLKKGAKDAFIEQT